MIIDKMIYNTYNYYKKIIENNVRISLHLVLGCNVNPCDRIC